MKDIYTKNELIRKYQENLNDEIKNNLSPEAASFIFGNTPENKYNCYINLIGKDKFCTEKDDNLTIEEKKTILTNTLELLEVDINKNFNNKINIFPKVNEYTKQAKKIFDNFKDKINTSIYNKDSQSNFTNYEGKVITLLKKLDRNHIFEYEDKKFYPFIYDILNTNSFISFKIYEYKDLIKTINSLKLHGDFEPINNELKDIIQINEIFQANQLHNLIYILFDEFDSNKEYESLMKLIFYKNDDQKNIFTNQPIHSYLKMLDKTTENTITIHKHFHYS